MNERDERLAAVLDSLAARAAADEVIDIQAEAAKHGDLAEELVELWGAVMLAEALGSHLSDQVSATVDGSNSTAITPAGPIELPCNWGDFRLLAEIGRGGMGVVYHARQLSLDRDVAVKMIIEGKLASSADQARFQGEAEAAARLDHPGIVPVYEVGEHDHRPYFSMKYIAGETLQARIARGPMPPRQAAQVLLEVARAVDFAHRHGVLHRDLKPSNIILDEQGRAHVTDFGLAKRVDQNADLTRTGAVLGTPAYMPPEQAGSRGMMGAASDVYSLGAVLYAMLTGRPPFVAASHFDTLLMVLEQDPRPPHFINRSADRDLEMIALKCLQKPADLRYETAAALANDLQAYLQHESISARSGQFNQVFSRLFRETHHATVLENWGLLWMWHSLVLLVISVLTNLLSLAGVSQRWPYFLLWTLVAGTWAAIFWWLRRRMGPVTFVERQVAHVWAGSMIGVALLFPLEALIDPAKPVLWLSPVLAVISGIVFLVKAGILNGSFYFQAIALFVTAFVMGAEPVQPYAHFLLGVVGAACFFVPGLKYYRQRLANEADAE